MGGAIGAAVAPMWSRACLAFEYPVRPARILVGFPPGSSSDIVACVVAQLPQDQKPIPPEELGVIGWPRV
jgi:tripartite-type tricarboxylate transporter receptor subunit TctC